LALERGAIPKGEAALFRLGVGVHPAEELEEPDEDELRLRRRFGVLL
jgi:hypothetical protein